MVSNHAKIGQRHKLTINDILRYTKDALGWAGGYRAGDTGLSARVESRATSTCDRRGAARASLGKL